MYKDLLNAPISGYKRLVPLAPAPVVAPIIPVIKAEEKPQSLAYKIERLLEQYLGEIGSIKGLELETEQLKISVHPKSNQI